jgi:exodeoxyribonuclease VII large subunit
MLALSTEHNVAEYTVSELSNILKKRIEENFSYVRVRGEVSGAKLAPSGHLYFSLKDGDAILAAICWRTTLGKCEVKPQDGLEIICSGTITTYPGQSKYQIIVEKVEHAGIGALMALLEKRKQALEKEGLFASERKKPIPFMPKKIGIITSPTGAVIRDMLHRIRERMPVHIMLWPVLVQSEMAAKQIANAIDGFNNLPSHLAPDTIIVARGGGSIEDLWAFNEEIVVRAAANSKIPLISAVGHETDVTLIDFASDLRAPTPTAAAEFAVPVRSDLLSKVDFISARINADLTKLMKTKQLHYSNIHNSMPKYQLVIVNLLQKMDEKAIRLGRIINNLIHHRHLQLNTFKLEDQIIKWQERKKHKYGLVSVKLEPAKYMRFLNGSLAHVDQLGQALNNNLKRIFDTHNLKLNYQEGLLNSYSYKKVLGRGYSIIRRPDNGEIIKSLAQLKVSQAIQVELEDGVCEVKVNQ